MPTATMDPSLHGIDTLATGNLLPESITRHGLSSERTSSSGGVAVQESVASLPCGPLFCGITVTTNQQVQWRGTGWSR